MDEIQIKVSNPVIPSDMSIHFIKGNDFRVIHASGVWFGADPQGNVHLTFYNERTAIPKKIVIKIEPSTGKFIGEDETKRDSKEGLVREMEVDVVVSPAVAQGIVQKLQENIIAVTQAQAAVQELEKKSQSR
jgi:hypothetical protein